MKSSPPATPGPAPKACSFPIPSLGYSERQYHIGLAPGEVAPSILLVGDPARAGRVADMLDRVDTEHLNREYVTYTGVAGDLPVTVMATGIGADNTEIAVVELCQCVEKPTIIRCGSCGSLQPDVRLGDLVLSRAAYRLENTSLQFVGEGYPAAADPEVLLALARAADELGHPHHLGITATAPGFYGAQGRSVPGFPPRNADIVADLARQGVLNLEMETSCLFTLASLRGFRAGSVCAVYAERAEGGFITPAQKDAAELRCIETGLRALGYAADMERARGDRPLWHPGLGAGPGARRGS